MKENLTYWLLARFPRWVVVTGIIAIKWLYRGVVIAMLMYASFLLTILTLSNTWVGTPSLFYLFAALVFAMVFFLTTFTSLALFGILKEMIDIFISILKFTYYDHDRKLPKRESKKID